MKTLISLFFLVVSLSLTAQKKTGTAVKLIVIRPDTAIVDDIFFKDADTIVARQIRQYDQSVKLMESLVNCVDCPRDEVTSKKMNDEYLFLKSIEKDMKNTKYYHLLASYSKAIYNFYFQENNPLSSVIEIPATSKELTHLKSIADSSQASYIIYFDNIHSAYNEKEPVLKVNTYLYSGKENKVIFSKETEGDIVNVGEMWTCDDSVRLSCMTMNAVKSSTTAVLEFLEKSVRKNK